MPHAIIESLDQEGRGVAHVDGKTIFIEGALIGGFLYFAVDRFFNQYGAVYLVVLGLATLLTALYSRGGVWGQICRFVDAPWFPIGRKLIRFKA